MSLASVVSGFVVGAAVGFASFVLLVCVAVSRAAADEIAADPDLGEQISEVNTPSQLAHSQPGGISERAGKGDGFDHEPNNATEVGQ